MASVSTVAEAAIAPAMISLCTKQALHARVDQAGAELREIEHAGDQRDQAGEIEEDDAAGEAGEALRNEKLPGRTQRPPDRVEALALGTRDFLAGPFGLGVLRQNFRGSIEHVVQSRRVDRRLIQLRMILSENRHPLFGIMRWILPQAGTLCQSTRTPASLKMRHVSLKR